MQTIHNSYIYSFISLISRALRMYSLCSKLYTNYTLNYTLRRSNPYIVTTRKPYIVTTRKPYIATARSFTLERA